MWTDRLPRIDACKAAACPGPLTGVAHGGGQVGDVLEAFGVQSASVA
ncbi:hypothetical protein [Streptomyces sp. KR55]